MNKSNADEADSATKAPKADSELASDVIIINKTVNHNEDEADDGDKPLKADSKFSPDWKSTDVATNDYEADSAIKAPKADSCEYIHSEEGYAIGSCWRC